VPLYGFLTRLDECFESQGFILAVSPSTTPTGAGVPSGWALANRKSQEIKTYFPIILFQSMDNLGFTGF
jgi:hypothetical protein